VLIFAFVMAGANKITDAIHAETHQELAKGFVQYGPVSALKFSIHVHACLPQSKKSSFYDPFSSS
jgi:hypothetical protein